ncbi:hypothetical protein RB595_003571 [Gaeumannomyces hyphopodioides]
MRFAQLALASLFAGAMAAPAPAPVAEVAAAPAEGANVLAKRAEGIHLVNCETTAGRIIYSAVVYCPNDSDCNRNPGAGNSCVPGGIITWERSNGSCRFSTGVTFTWGIASNAQSFPNFQQVGDGGNGGTHFKIFKDDKHRMYTDGNGYSCKSIYYGLS